jgi:hypothetical protein
MVYEVLIHVVSVEDTRQHGLDGEALFYPFQFAIGTADTDQTVTPTLVLRDSSVGDNPMAADRLTAPPPLSYLFFATSPIQKYQAKRRHRQTTKKHSSLRSFAIDGSLPALSPINRMATVTPSSSSCSAQSVG